MSSHHLVHGALLLFARFPKVGGVFGLLVAAAFGFLGFSNWQDLQTMPEVPETLTLSEAVLRLEEAEDIWVELESVEWDCDNIVSSGGGSDARTNAIFTDEPHSVLGLATFSSRVSCAELPDGAVEGVLRRMSEGVYERLPGRGFDLAEYADANTRLSLCTFCGRGNSMLGVILGAIFVPPGLSLYPLCLYLREDFRKKGLL
ncbi:MAG: hypothetical protein PVH95_13265 [Anaerolineae bacterium]|jgi:hypothetical protein